MAATLSSSSDQNTEDLDHPVPAGEIIVSDGIQNVVNEALSKYSEGDIRRLVFHLDKHGKRVRSNQIILITLLITIWLLVITNAILLGIWAWLFDQIYSSLTKTFAWEALQSSFGSLFEWVNVCAVGVKNGKFQDCSKSKIKYGRPFIPILSIVLLGLFNIFAVCFVFFTKCRKFILLSMKRLIFVQLIFVFIGIPITSILLAQDLSALKSTMRSEMKSWQIDGNRWNLTQEKLSCCGVNSALEWIEEITYVPLSCCNTSKPECQEIRTSSNVWRNGCFEFESQIVNYFSMVEIASLLLGFIVAIALYFASKSYLDNSNFSRVSTIRGGRFFECQRPDISIISL